VPRTDPALVTLALPNPACRRDPMPVHWIRSRYTMDGSDHYHQDQRRWVHSPERRGMSPRTAPAVGDTADVGSWTTIGDCGRTEDH